MTLFLLNSESLIKPILSVIFHRSKILLPRRWPFTSEIRTAKTRWLMSQLITFRVM